MPAAMERTAMRPALGSVHGLVPAALLIFIGLVLQLGAFGYGLVSPGHFWLISVIAGNTWNAIVSHLIAPAFGSQTELWPLLLVGAGVAFLLDRARARRRQIIGVASGGAASVSSFSGANHAQ